MAVGSRAGAVLRRRGLSVSPRFLWECLTSRTVSPFPARPWPHRSPLADHPVPVGIPHVGVRGMAAAHWRDPVAPCFSAGDAPVAVVVVLTERAAAACRNRSVPSGRARAGGTRPACRSRGPCAVLPIGGPARGRSGNGRA